MSNPVETGSGRPPMDTRNPALDTTETKVQALVEKVTAKITELVSPDNTLASPAAVRKQNEALKEFVYLEILPALNEITDQASALQKAALSALETDIYRTMGNLRQRESAEEYHGMVDTARQIRSDMRAEKTTPIEHAAMAKSLDRMIAEEPVTHDAAIEDEDQEENAILRTLFTHIQEKLAV